MLTRDEIREARKGSITEMITNMGFERDSFMYLDMKEPRRMDHGGYIGGLDDVFKMDMQVYGTNSQAVGITGSNNGTYAAYLPGGQYIVTQDRKIIEALQEKCHFQDTGLGVLLSNGERFSSSYDNDQWEKVKTECARINRNNEWEYNRQQEAKAFDGVSFEGYTFKSREGKDEMGSMTAGEIKTPDGKTFSINSFYFENDNKYGKMAQEFSSKEFEEKVYKGEVGKDEVMGRLDGADKAGKEFEESKGRLKTAQEKLNSAEKELDNSRHKEINLRQIDENIKTVQAKLKNYLDKNPKKAPELQAYISDIIKSAAQGKEPEMKNPLEPKGFFGKTKAFLFGRKIGIEGTGLETAMSSLQSTLKRNPDAVKGNKDFSLDSFGKKIESNLKEASDNVKRNTNARENAKGSLEATEKAVARGAFHVAKFNKLKDTVSKLFSDKEAAKEIALKSMARDTTGIKDINANSGVDKLAEKAKAMEGMTAGQRLEQRMSQLRGMAKEEPKKAAARSMDSNMAKRAMDNKTRG